MAKKNKPVKTASVSDLEKIRFITDHLATFVNPFSVCSDIAAKIVAENPDKSVIELKKLISDLQNGYFHSLSQ